MNLNRIVKALFFVVVVIAQPVLAQQINGYLPLIPYPKTLKTNAGDFNISPASVIVLIGNQFESEADQLNIYFANSFGRPLKKQSVSDKQSIVFKYDENIQSSEGYQIKITPQEAVLSARTSAGMFMAVQTMRQLLPVAAERKTSRTVKTLSLPSLSIKDEPAYAYRGMMLDVARHFFSIQYLEKFIDRMALYKMNTLHLHLTDDQGWRIEIKKYPKLTEEGAWRSFNNQDSACMKRSAENPDFIIDSSHIIVKNGKTLYGGFYTQAEMKGVVAYAAARHINIIPEIDMPGHMMAAINLYPFLTCNGENNWGESFTKPICPCKESTYEFVENVYSEIMEIFPSKYIHIGGDEVDRRDWAKSADCMDLMKRDSIKDLAALQSYFINRMEKFFNSRGRMLIGWDEIIEGGISPTAIVMYWRTWVPKAPIEAVKNGNTVIMSPGEPLYFDYPEDKYSLDKIYHFHVVPGVLNANEGKAIIGAQANMWAEMIPSEKRADYMTMPRMTALAERLWTGQPDMFTSYQHRLEEQYKRMDVLGINYRLADLPGLLNEYVFVDKTSLTIVPPLKSFVIRYTTDGSLPNKTSPVLPTPLGINKPQELRVAAFTPVGKRGDVYKLKFKQESLIVPVAKSDLKSGLQADYYKAFFPQSSQMQTAKSDSSFLINNITVPASAKAPSFGIRFKGYIDVPTDGVYSFFLTADDGAVLRIGDRMVVDNDGNHSAQERSGQVALKKGAHPFELYFIEGGGGYILTLKYSLNGSVPVEIPDSWFSH